MTKRDIKFRARINSSNEYEDVLKIDFILGKVMLYARGWFDFDDVELEQYTGLKDVNDVEVYEGDIITCTKGCPHKVVWVEAHGGTFFGGMPGWYLSGLDYGYAWTGQEEVVGNVHMNPELLEV